MPNSKMGQEGINGYNSIAMSDLGQSFSIPRYKINFEWLNIQIVDFSDGY
jgi:hypothetical protein